jgi:DNA polymerase III sliding clamp (beta) subunit (PCNA family)
LLLGEKELVIRARNPEGDTVDSTVSEKHIHSRPAGGFCMGFNGGYLLEMLDAVGTEQVELSSSSSESICLITPQDEDSWHYMLAPMRL